MDLRHMCIKFITFMCFYASRIERMAHQKLQNFYCENYEKCLRIEILIPINHKMHNHTLLLQRMKEFRFLYRFYFQSIFDLFVLLIRCFFYHFVSMTRKKGHFYYFALFL